MYVCRNVGMYADLYGETGGAHAADTQHRAFPAAWEAQVGADIPRGAWGIRDLCSIAANVTRCRNQWEKRCCPFLVVIPIGRLLKPPETDSAPVLPSHVVAMENGACRCIILSQRHGQSPCFEKHAGIVGVSELQVPKPDTSKWESTRDLVSTVIAGKPFLPSIAMDATLGLQGRLQPLLTDADTQLVPDLVLVF